jgi:hypothetical protein
MRPSRLLRVLLPLSFAFAALGGGAIHAADLRVGLIGLDTSHVIAFTRALNDPKNKDHVPGAKAAAPT